MDKRSDFIKSYKEKFEVRTVAYLPTLAQVVGINAAIMLSQLIFWSGNARSIERDGWFYKSVQDLKEETGLSKRQQQSARRVLLETGLIQAKLVGIPRTWHYKVNLEALDELLRSNQSIQEIGTDQGQALSNKATTSVQNGPNIGSSSRPTLGPNVPQLNKVLGKSKEITSSKHRGTQESKAPSKRPRTQKSPEIELFRKITGRYPRKDQYELVIKAAAGKSYDDLKPYWDEWVARDYRRTNLAWLLDWADQGYIPSPKSKRRKEAGEKLQIQTLPIEADEVSAEYYRLNPNSQEGA